MSTFNILPLLLAGALLLAFPACKTKTADYYSPADFEKVDKVDSHFHYDTPDISYMKLAESVNFIFFSPNVDAGMSIDEQLEITSNLRKNFPDRFAFTGTYSVDNFNDTGFSDQIIARIDECMRAGASGIKIWKNIGMVQKDAGGRYVMADDPAFDPVYKYLEDNRIPLLAHLGEPLNCWLPLEEMTLGNDRRYFAANPEYHMYLLEGTPSYEDQINARDNILKRFPDLIFSGAHLGSLEWSVDELAKRLDAFPNMSVDLSARVGHLQYQSLSDYEKVRNFMIKYQDRIMYGSDTSVSERDTDYNATIAALLQNWKNEWAYLATDSVIIVNDLENQEVKGLQLPKDVVDKLYYKNAVKFFSL